MADQENKERKVLFVRKSEGDSVIGTGAMLEIAMILLALFQVIRVVVALSEYRASVFEIIVGFVEIVLLVFFAIRLGNAFQNLGEVVAENAALKTAVRYLCSTHNIEVRSPECDLTSENLGTEEDGGQLSEAIPAIRCPSCGHEQPANNLTCESCGRRFFTDE